MSTLIILLLSFIILLALNKYVMRTKFSISQLGRLAMAIMLVFTGAAHFIKTQEMVQMMPDFLPYKIWFVYATGLLEIAAATGLLLQRWTISASVALIIFFVVILPANIIGSIRRVELGGMENGPMYLIFRIPLQIFFIWWTYYFGIYLFKGISTNRSDSFSHT
jgi:uncharacterized membrane protein